MSRILAALALAEDGDEELDRVALGRGGISQPGLLAGVVDEALVAGAVDLAHRQATPLQPAAVDLAELGVAVAGRVLLQVLAVEQLQGDAGLASLGVDPVSRSTSRRGRARHHGEARPRCRRHRRTERSWTWSPDLKTGVAKS
jgi:hypothetical protein